MPGTDVTSGQLNIAGFQEAAERVTRDFGPPMVAITLRESVSASDNGWSAVLWDASTKTMHRSQRYDVRLVDRIGGGDSFAGGLIYGLVTGRTPPDALRFAVAASALKQTIPGDFNRVSVAEVDRLVGGDASGACSDRTSATGNDSPDDGATRVDGECRVAASPVGVERGAPTRAARGR